MQSTINSFLEDLSKHPRWTQFKSEVRKKLNAELNRLKGSISKGTWQSAEKNYNQIIKKLSSAQKQVDQEVQKTLKSLKKSAAEMEKTIGQYKAIALKQKAQVKKATPTRKAPVTKKTKKVAPLRKKISRS
jgi:hypothetical protein